MSARPPSVPCWSRGSEMVVARGQRAPERPSRLPFQLAPKCSVFHGSAEPPCNRCQDPLSVHFTACPTQTAKVRGENGGKRFRANLLFLELSGVTASFMCFDLAITLHAKGTGRKKELWICSQHLLVGYLYPCTVDSELFICCGLQNRTGLTE